MKPARILYLKKPFRDNYIYIIIIEIVEFEGNTMTQIPASKRWCFVLNNYEKQHIVEIVATFVKLNYKYIIGEEVGESGTPHLQGYCESPKVFRPFAIFKKYNAHWEKCKGNRKSNIAYCSKDGKYHTNMHIPRPLMKITKADLRSEQLEIANLFEDYANKFDRKIYWYWEHIGNWGKTVLAIYMVDQMGAIIVGGKAADAGYAIQQYIEKNGEGPKIVIMDIPRTRSAEYISYESIENIKNGCFFSGKYEGGMVRFNKPHLIVFANEPPETSRMSSDRWVITQLAPPM